MSEQELREKLAEICVNIKGLSVEVEQWRQHTSTNGDFFLDALRDLLAAVKKLQAAVNE